MTKKITKALAVVLCAILLVVATIMGTIAYLTSETTVSNTFTAGKVAITLDEAKTDEYGVKQGDARVDGNEYKLIPGHTYVKDAKITVSADSESCYLFVKLDTAFLDLCDVTMGDDDNDNYNWNVLDSDNGLYYYTAPVVADTTVTAIESFTINTDLTTADLAGITTANIVAYAVQKDGFDSATEAWSATFGASQSNS